MDRIRGMASIHVCLDYQIKGIVKRQLKLVNKNNGLNLLYVFNTGRQLTPIMMFFNLKLFIQRVKCTFIPTFIDQRGWQG